MGVTVNPPQRSLLTRRSSWTPSQIYWLTLSGSISWEVQSGRNNSICYLTRLMYYGLGEILYNHLRFHQIPANLWIISVFPINAKVMTPLSLGWMCSLNKSDVLLFVSARFPHISHHSRPTKWYIYLYISIASHILILLQVDVSCDRLVDWKELLLTPILSGRSIMR